MGSERLGKNLCRGGIWLVSFLLNFFSVVRRIDCRGLQWSCCVSEDIIVVLGERTGRGGGRCQKKVEMGSVIGVLFGGQGMRERRLVCLVRGDSVIQQEGNLGGKGDRGNRFVLVLYSWYLLDLRVFVKKVVFISVNGVENFLEVVYRCCFWVFVFCERVSGSINYDGDKK